MNWNESRARRGPEHGSPGIALAIVAAVALLLILASTARAAPNVIHGTPGPDVLIGTSGPDVIYGHGGPDELRGLGGNDRLLGGPGRDVLHGGRGSNVYYGGPGNDRVLSGFTTGYERISCGVGIDLLYVVWASALADAYGCEVGQG